MKNANTEVGRCDYNLKQILINFDFSQVPLLTETTKILSWTIYFLLCATTILTTTTARTYEQLLPTRCCYFQLTLLLSSAQQYNSAPPPIWRVFLNVLKQLSNTIVGCSFFQRKQFELCCCTSEVLLASKISKYQPKSTLIESTKASFDWIVNRSSDPFGVRKFMN